ncbi:MAG: hypothetical protein BV456_08200 [Thermoplasmata archaeon M8B2D]|nr:MAG: hypothetical protein BV456_08200 [Thermoplasmata archaeon M8B2D]
MLDDLLRDIYQESKKQKIKTHSEKIFIETILNHIYQFLYKRGQPVHTVGIGILRGNTFDMYYSGRLLKKYSEIFGAMSYDTTIAGRACELYKNNRQYYLNLFSKKKILQEFDLASEEFKKLGLEDEAESLKKRGTVTIDQGIGSFLLMPISFGDEIIGIFTISSLNETDSKKFLGEDIEKNFIPIAQLLSLILYMEKISYDKAEDMGKILISSIDAKDEYQATHSLNVRTVIDIFIDEISRDKELRERVESIGFNLTVDKIEKLRLAALLHDIGKIFIPNEILRKSRLSKEELLIRKMHPYLTYNILMKSQIFMNIAEIASLHHARYHIPSEKIESSMIGYPFDRFGQDKFIPETQIIALADTLNSMVRIRPDRKGLSLSEALDLIEKLENKFHEGLKNIFLTILRRVEKNIKNGKYPPFQEYNYRKCLWINQPKQKRKIDANKWNDLHEFLDKIKFNNLGILSLIEWSDAPTIFKSDKEIKIKNRKIHLTKIKDKHILISIRNVPNEEGFIWISNIYDFLKNNSFKGKISFAFIGNSGCEGEIEDIYNSLINGLSQIKYEPVHYYLEPILYKCKDLDFVEG